MWLKADALTGLADGDSVAAWADSSGSGHDGASSSPNQPVYRTNISNGLAAVEFNGAQDIDIAGFGDILSGDDTYTLAILNHPRGSFGNYPIMLTWPTNAIWQWIVEYDASSGVYWGHTNGTYRLYTTATGIDTWPILAMTKTVATDGTFRQSGTDVTAYSTAGAGMVATPAMTGAVRLGGYWDHGFSFDGHIAEVVYYSKVLSPSDLAKVEGYLAWKWGRVGDLPAGHPYKSALPVTTTAPTVFATVGAPTVTASATATPATAAAAAVVATPADSTGETSTPATVTATAAVAAPTVGVGQDITTTPATMTAAASTAGGAAPWAPSLVADLGLWLDASQITGLSGGDPVSIWPDASGAGATTTSAGFSPPTFHTGVINGLPVVRFSTTSGSQALRTTMAVNLPYTMAVVGHLTGGSNQRLVGSIYPDAENWLVGWWNGNEDVMYGEGFVAPGGVAATTNWKLYTVTGSGALTSFYGQGSLIASNASGNTGPANRLALSGYQLANNAELSDGELAEVVVFARVLTDTERQQLEGYLAWKYGMQAELPIGHPYLAAPPTTTGAGPAITTGETATPATVAAAAAAGVPAESTGARAAPASAATTTAVSAPTITSPATATPATVTASTTAATPTVATGSRTVPLTFLATTAVPAPTVHIGTSMVPATLELLAAIGAPVVVTVTVPHITTPVFAVAVGSGRSAAPVAVSAVGAAVAANGRGGVNVDPSSTGSVLSGDGRTLAEVS